MSVSPMRASFRRRFNDRAQHRPNRLPQSLDGREGMAVASTDPTYRAAVERRVVEASRAVLAGHLSITAGSRILVGYAFELGVENDPVFLDFRGIDSETDTFPVGDVRAQWSSAALAREDAERERYEGQVRAVVQENCRLLIARYGSSAV